MIKYALKVSKSERVRGSRGWGGERRGEARGGWRREWEDGRKVAQVQAFVLGNGVSGGCQVDTDNETAK